MDKAFGLDIPENLTEACDPRRAALVVYDMQIGILRQLRNGATVTSKVAAALAAARGAGMRVVFMRHMSLPNELAGAFQLRMAKAWQGLKSAADVKPWFLRDSPGFGLVPEMAPKPSEAIFDKITMSAFEGTPLDIALRDCGIGTVVICGVATEIGIEPTVRHAADLGYIPVVLTDACGAGDEDAGQRALASLKFMGDAMFATVEEFGAVVSGKR